jgi:hypothetical protein
MYVTGMEDISKLGHTFEQSYVWAKCIVYCA